MLGSVSPEGLVAIDNLGRCALHYAACQGNVEVIERLLEQSESEFSAHSQLSLLDSDGTTPLHEAVAGKHVNVVRLLVNAGASVNACAEGKMPPIYLAHFNVDRTDAEKMSSYEEIIDILVSKNANVNLVEPETGFGVLYRAVELDSRKATEKLISGGADVFKHSVKLEGTTVLHFAAEAGYGKTLSIILNHDAFTTLSEENPSRFDVHDKLGRTPLHAAVYKGHTDCVRILISKGLCLVEKDNDDKTVVDAIFENVRQPVAFLTEILDEQVTCPEFGDVVTMKFQMLAALPTTSSSYATGFDEISNLRVLLALITPLSIVEPTAIIQHPLVAHFLQKILAPRDIWKIMNAFFNLVYFVALCSIIICRTSIDGGCFPLSAARLTIVPMSLVLLGYRTGNFIFLFREFEHFIDVWNFRCFLVVIWLVNLFTNLLAMCVSCTPYSVSCTNSNCWNLWPKIFLTMLLPWAFIMQILTYFPRRGPYIFMFYTVLYTVFKVLATFSAVIFSFAYSFRILFSGTDQFSSFWKSYVKTLVMMTGEYDYNSLPRNETNSTSVENNDDGLVLRSIILLIFVIVINIVLMNLMIGLAVNDINKLSEESRSRWLKLRAVILLHTLTRRYLKRRIYAIFARCNNEPTSKLCSCLEGELKLRWDEIPEDIKEGIREVALRKSSNRDKESDKKMNSPRDITREILAAIQPSLAALKSSQAAMQSSLQKMLDGQELQN